MKVYQCIKNVMAELGKEGITKNRKNQQQGYNFRGIDDVYNSLSHALSLHGLVVLPRVLSREVTERVTAKGGAIFYVVVEVEFDFVCAEDGSKHTVKTYGEAMDSADKATNKAMSAAYKYAAMQAFCIPTEGDNDADAHTHDVKAAKVVHAEMVNKAKKLAADIQAADTIDKVNNLAVMASAIEGITPAITTRLSEVVNERINQLSEVAK